MKKLLVVGVIVLFLGLAIAPSINANVSKASIDSELVEITTEICGIDGVKPHTVSLSKEDAEEVDRLFDSIKERLDNVETREDTEQIFNEAVVELDKYGLLGGLSVKQAQKLVTGGYQNRRVMKALEKLYSRNQELYDNNSNLLCLVSGRTTYTSGFGLVQSVLAPFFGVLSLLALFIWELLGADGLFGLFVLLFGMLTLLCLLNPLPYISPLAIGYFLGFGVETSYYGGGHYRRIPSEGFINSYGLKGNKQWSGKFWGQGILIPSLFIYLNLNPMLGSSPVGVAGFTGIKIMLEFENGNTSFFGSALWVKLDTGLP